jgi:hypothetical protein
LIRLDLSLQVNKMKVKGLVRIDLLRVPNGQNSGGRFNPFE